MAKKRDYYEILGVNKNSTKEEIKKAYRKKAMQYHPDKNPGDKAAEEKFKEAAEAYDVLKDDDKKAAYDQYGHSAFQGGMGGRGGFQSAHFNDFSDIFSAFGDIFGDFGGGQRRRKRSSAADGSDLKYNVEITLKEAFDGKTEEVEFTAPVKCSDCKGKGTEKGSSTIECPKCNGSGFERKQQGFFIVENTCSKCRGTGEIIKNPCKTCGGTGRTNKSRTLSVKIPAGIQNGNRIRLAGQGEAGSRGGHPGDLYVFVSVKPHKFFERVNSDIYCRVPILITTAILGGEIKIPTIEGTEALLKIPSGTETHSKFRLRGKGMPVLNSKDRRGDMFVEVQIDTPKHLSAEEKSLIKKLDKILQEKQKNSKNGFFKKWFK